MKKIFSVLLITTIVTTLGSPVYASSQNPSDLQECIENTMFYNNEYRLFNEFTYQGMEINLLPETTITKEEALIKYKEAYDYIAGKASVLGIVPNLDNYEFQQYVKGYAIPTSTNKEFNDKLAEFAEFIDIYENAEGQSAIRRGWSDCTNFVSQCLSYGGFKYRKSGLFLPHRQSKNWYYDNGKPSHTWGGANNFYQHWKSRAGIAKTSDLLTAGDVISVDFTKDGDIDHTAIITSNINNTNESKLLTQHSIDRSEFLPTGDYFSLAYLYSQDYKIYGYEMDKALVK